MDWHARAIRAYLAGAPELLRAEYADSSHPLAGHCYIASEAYYHAHGGPASDLTIWHINHEDASHWFLRDGGSIVDLTAEQFTHPPVYADATRKGFLTRQPSKRAQTVLDALPTPTDFTKFDTDGITTLGIDIDGVLGEQVAPVMEYTNETYDTDYPLTVNERDPLLPDLDRKFSSLLKEARIELDDYYGSMPVLPGAKAALDRLSEDYRLVIVTHRPPESLDATQAWLDTNGFTYDEFLNPVPENKADADVDILIDDFPSNVDDFLTAGKPAIQFVRSSVLKDPTIIPTDAWTATHVGSLDDLANNPARQWQALVDDLCAVAHRAKPA